LVAQGQILELRAARARRIEGKIARSVARRTSISENYEASISQIRSDIVDQAKERPDADYAVPGPLFPLEADSAKSLVSLLRVFRIRLAVRIEHQNTALIIFLPAKIKHLRDRVCDRVERAVDAFPLEPIVLDET